MGGKIKLAVIFFTLAIITIINYNNYNDCFAPK
jgi:hypothetical protein